MEDGLAEDGLAVGGLAGGGSGRGGPPTCLMLTGRIPCYAERK